MNVCVVDAGANPDVEGVINIVLVILVTPVELSMKLCVVAVLAPKLIPVNVNADILFTCADEFKAAFVKVMVYVAATELGLSTVTLKLNGTFMVALLISVPTVVFVILLPNTFSVFWATVI